MRSYTDSNDKKDGSGVEVVEYQLDNYCKIQNKSLLY